MPTTEPPELSIADQIKAMSGVDVPPFIVDWLDALVWLDLNVTMVCSKDVSNAMTMWNVREQLKGPDHAEVWEHVRKAWLTQHVGEQVQRIHDHMAKKEAAADGQAD